MRTEPVDSRSSCHSTWDRSSQLAGWVTHFPPSDVGKGFRRVSQFLSPVPDLHIVFRDLYFRDGYQDVGCSSYAPVSDHDCHLLWRLCLSAA